MIDLTGKKFERLIVVERAPNSKDGRIRWLCLCDCGIGKVIRGDHLKSGETQSCGCLQKEIVIKTMTEHGHKKNGKPTKIYHIWDSMIQRCTNPNHKSYQDYGGRGIMVCEEWMEFPNFLRDNPGWELGLTVERDNNELGYFKDNCYWGTRTEQARNKRNNRLIKYNNKIQCVAAWSEETGIPYEIIYWRITHGWPPEKALTEPIKNIREEKNDEEKV